LAKKIVDISLNNINLSISNTLLNINNNGVNIYSDIYNSTNDIDQGIELADDLLKSYSTYMRNMPPPVQVPVESNYISSSSTKHDNLVTNSNSTNITNDQNSKNNHSITNTDRHGTSAIPEISKQMKFTSAKDQYLAEVIDKYK
jgi:hypothetical protein